MILVMRSVLNSHEVVPSDRKCILRLAVNAVGESSTNPPKFSSILTDAFQLVPKAIGLAGLVLEFLKKRRSRVPSVGSHHMPPRESFLRADRGRHPHQDFLVTGCGTG
jgi:hypothetical protein